MTAAEHYLRWQPFGFALVSVTVSGSTTSFVYDGDGNLVKKINPDNSKTLYIGGRYEVNKNSGGTVTSTKTYYPAAGAMRVDGTRYYMVSTGSTRRLKDHLGSASVVTNQSATTVGKTGSIPSDSRKRPQLDRSGG